MIATEVNYITWCSVFLLFGLLAAVFSFNCDCEDDDDEAAADSCHVMLVSHSILPLVKYHTPVVMWVDVTWLIRFSLKAMEFPFVEYLSSLSVLSQFIPVSLTLELIPIISREHYTWRISCACYNDSQRRFIMLRRCSFISQEVPEVLRRSRTCAVVKTFVIITAVFIHTLIRDKHKPCISNAVFPNPGPEWNQVFNEGEI